MTADLTTDGKLEFTVVIPAVNERKADAKSIAAICCGFKAQWVIEKVLLKNLVRKYLLRFVVFAPLCSL